MQAELCLRVFTQETTVQVFLYLCLIFHEFVSVKCVNSLGCPTVIVLMLASDRGLFVNRVWYVKCSRGLFTSYNIQLTWRYYIHSLI